MFPLSNDKNPLLERSFLVAWHLGEIDESEKRIHHSVGRQGMSFKALIVVSMLGAAAVAYGHPMHPPLEKRTPVPIIREHQIHQRERIRSGVRTGRLTHAEAARLRREQRLIRNEIQTAKAYGGMTRIERAKIRHEQRMASEHIDHLKHNRTEQLGS